MSTAALLALIKKNPIITVCVVLTIALAATIYLRSDAIPDANNTLDQKSTEAQRYALNIANAVQLKDHLEALKAANKVVESRMVHASDIGINQQFFYKLESDSGVKLTDLRQGRVMPTKTAYAPIEFNVSLQGDFPAVLKFLRELEDGAHYCRVVTASCAAGRSGPVSLTVTVELLGHP